MLEFPGEGVNLQKSAVFCENLRFGLSLSPWVCHLKLALTIDSFPIFSHSLCHYLIVVLLSEPNLTYPEFSEP